MVRSGLIPAHGAAKDDKPAKPGVGRRLWRWLQRPPVRTFAISPLIVIAFELIRHGGTLTIVPWGALLLGWGYLQYRIVGSYRWRHGGGGPGIDVPPQRIVADGPYRYTRNPMYLGHLIFLAGLALTFRSWLALAILILNAAWFHRRVLGDEARLLAQFGEPYAAYCKRVKRWIPGLI
jgi:protein-S-isoprenylcysteine O-methyltransferase Ste14